LICTGIKTDYHLHRFGKQTLYVSQMDDANYNYLQRVSESWVLAASR